jgi:DUF971 family protein
LCPGVFVSWWWHLIWLWYKYEPIGRGEFLPYLTPTLVKRVSPVQTDITWNDGHFGSYPSWYLRENCPCASCVDEFSGERRNSPGSVPAGLERISVTPVGNYALGFAWSDGHSTGIYTFEYLRKLCPCPQCLPKGLPEPPQVVLKPGSFEV